MSYDNEIGAIFFGLNPSSKQCVKSTFCIERVGMPTASYMMQRETYIVAYRLHSRVSLPYQTHSVAFFNRPKASVLEIIIPHLALDQFGTRFSFSNFLSKFTLFNNDLFIFHLVFVILVVDHL